jgi:UTP--glucose-1-phosphate uridylyltransferase
LGDAISYAKQHIGEEPFAVLLGDTLIDSVIPVTQQLIDLYEQYRQSLVAIEPVPKDRVGRYGIISGNKISDKIWQVTEIVEKPRIDRSPSNLAIAGRYILTPDIFRAIEQTEPDASKNIELTDALNILITRQNIFAYIIEGNRYALDDKFDFLKTTVDLALKRKEFSSSFRKYLKERLK